MTSVTCTPPSVPPVRFQITQVSIVPNRMSPRSARSRSPSTLSSSQRTFGPAKYEASGRPGLAAEAVLADVAAELPAERVGAGVLPDEGVVDGLAGVPVPQQGGLALVGDADRLDVGGGDTRLDDRAGDDLLDIGPDLGGVVFDPARLGEDLLVLLLVDGDDPAVLVEDDAAAGRGALVDGGDERALVVVSGRSRCGSSESLCGARR